MDQETTDKLWFIEWSDSATNDGWKWEDESDIPPSPIQSVGWIVVDQPDYIVLAGCVSNEEGFKPSNNRRITIPKSIITKQIEILEHKHK